MIPSPVILICLAAFLVALTISIVMTPFVRNWSIRHGFMDYPGGHKEHKRPVAFGGGIAITVAIFVPMALAMALSVIFSHSYTNASWSSPDWIPDWPHWMGGIVRKIPQGIAIILGAVVLHVTGLIDDRRPMSFAPKLLVQVVVAVVLTAGFGIRSAEAMGPVPAVILTSLWIVGLTNAFNFLDNMDGLSAGVATITATVLAISAMLAGQVFVPCMLVLLVGAVVGFLIYNFPPASVFMGDAGSMVIGYFLAVCTVLTTFYNPATGRTPFGVVVPLLVFAIPIYDTGSVIYHRYRSGVSVFHADRRHFSHRLVERGMSRRLAVLTIYLATLATALPAILLPLHGWSVAILLLAQCISVVAIIAILEACDGS